MKRIIGALSTLPLVLFVAAPAYAQELCPPAFASLCKIRAEKGGGPIGAGITFLLVIAILLSVVFIIIGGIKWMTSGGDQSKIQQARNTVMAAVVGLIIGLLVFFIVGTILGLFGVNMKSMALPKLVP